jgi:hypothetical protein
MAVSTSTTARADRGRDERLLMKVLYLRTDRRKTGMTQSFLHLYGVFLTTRNPVTCSELEVLNSDDEIQILTGKRHVRNLDWTEIG